jgi:ABC-2 type transport system permease protein
MTSLLRAELLKLRSVTGTWWIVATSFGLMALEVATFALSASDGHGPGQRDDPDLLAHTMTAIGGVSVMAMILGILTVTQEFRFGTATPTFLVTPQRGRVVQAKMVVMGAMGLVLGACCLAIGLPLAVICMRARGEIVSWDATVWQVAAGAALVVMLYGSLGVAVGALVRNQIAAIAGSFTWLFVIEALVTATSPGTARWLPGGATTMVLQSTGWFGEYLGPPLLGVVVLITYAGVLGGLGVRFAMRRDLT